MNDVLTPSSPSEAAQMAVGHSFDLLEHVNPRSPSFFSSATALAAYLIHGNGSWLDACRCVLTAGIMSVTLAAARDNRTCSLTEIQDVLADAGRRIGVESSVPSYGIKVIANDAGDCINV